MKLWHCVTKAPRTHSTSATGTRFHTSSTASGSMAWPGWSGGVIRSAGALSAATALESGWEILENTDMVINRYREATIALDYYGDSVINSVSDIGAMILGFVLAVASSDLAHRRLLAIAMELGVLAGDSRQPELNILMLLVSTRSDSAVAGRLNTADCRLTIAD